MANLSGKVGLDDRAKEARDTRTCSRGSPGCQERPRTVFRETLIGLALALKSQSAIRNAMLPDVVDGDGYTTNRLSESDHDRARCHSSPETPIPKPRTTKISHRSRGGFSLSLLRPLVSLLRPHSVLAFSLLLPLSLSVRVSPSPARPPPPPRREKDAESSDRSQR
jgi:hypothetical protein